MKTRTCRKCGITSDQAIFVHNRPYCDFCWNTYELWRNQPYRERTRERWNTKHEYVYSSEPGE